jgi:hypothetical protein
MEPIVDNTSYAPKADETGAAYKARLAEIPNASPRVLKAANIIAKAMELGVYKPYQPDPDTFSAALDHITNALKSFGVTKGLAGARTDLIEAAIAGVAAKIGRKISVNDAKKLIGGKAETDLDASLGLAINKTWAELRSAADVGEQAPNKDVVKAYKDKDAETEKLVDTDLSRLAQEVMDLRETFRGVRKK